MERLLKRNLGIPKFLYKLLSKKASRIIAISQHTKKSLIVKTKIDARKIRLIYPGSEIADRKELLRSERAANAMRKSLGIGRKRVIGNISRIAQEKGQEYLLRAYELVKKSHLRTALVLAGKGPDEERLKRLLKQRKIHDVFFTGFVEDRSAILALMDIFVFPAAWELEGFGIVLVEAMLARKPIVAVEQGPVAEILEDGKNALLVKNQDPKQLAKAILKLLSHPGYAGKLAKRAHERARENFAIKDSAVRMLRELREATRKT
jgi:glycosyltransferase involved in cell wall biosynthesis